MITYTGCPDRLETPGSGDRVVEFEESVGETRLSGSNAFEEGVVGVELPECCGPGYLILKLD